MECGCDVVELERIVFDRWVEANECHRRIEARLAQIERDACERIAALLEEVRRLR